MAYEAVTANIANAKNPHGLPMLAERIPAMSPTAIDLVRRMESVVREMPQAPFKLDHLLHAGMYARTVTLPPGYWGGALVQEATILIVVGRATIFTGEDEPLRVSGVTVLPAAAGRKQAFVAEDFITLIMIAAVDAKTAPEAEAKLCAEPHILREGC
jgi:hypothetical protein